MRHLMDGRKLGRKAGHRKAMLRNLVTSLFREERVKTTVPKAREARRMAERIITRARRGELADRRLVARDVHDETVLRKLFSELGPRFADRPGGYTRLLKLGFRDGDAAPTAMLELLGAPAVRDRKKEDKKEKKEKEAAEKAKAPEEKAEKKAEIKAEKKEKAEKKAERKAAEKAPARRAAPAKDEKEAAEKKVEEKPRRRLGFGRSKKGGSAEKGKSK